MDNVDTVIMKPPKVKNKGANPIQITAEQLLQRAFLDRKKPFVQQDYKIRDEDDLDQIKQQKRRDFEQKIRTQRFHIGHWLKYALFEESLQEFRRARSVYERTLEVDYKNISIWLKYIEMEMRHKFINHARNLFERAIEFLPRVDQFWYKYAYMEELVGNYIQARNIYQRWMNWRPEEKAWLSFVAFEQRVGEIQNARQVMYNYMDAFPRLKTYLKVAKFEVKLGFKKEARKLLENTIEELGEESLKEEYFITFGKFEIREKEFDRAREIFKFGLENITKEKSKKLYEEYLQFEKQFGSKDEIDNLIFNERRLQYKKLISQNQNNYDAWFDLVNLEIETKNINRIRDTFENAIKNVPKNNNEKRLWRRYIYLWYSYATFEELEQGDILRANQIYERALKLVPHKNFTFSKLWVMYAQFQLRCQDLDKARKIFGIALGKCPNDKIFQEYIDLEYKLTNLVRVRQIYEKYIEVFPDNPLPFVQWAKLEKSLDELDRYRAIFEIAIAHQSMNMPETVWKSYIESEIELKEYENVRRLYEKLLGKSKNVKIWISYAQFEASIQEKGKCREVFKRAEEYFKGEKEMKEQRAMVIEQWKEQEIKFGDQEFIQQLQEKMPKRVKKQRKIKIVEGDLEEDAGYEEYYDYIFPGEEEDSKYLKILWKAQQRKKIQEQKQKEVQEQQKEIIN